MKKTEIEVIGLCFFRIQITEFSIQITEFSFRLLLPRLPEYNV